VPGIYLPSLVGAKNDTATVLEGREARSINRKTVDEAALFEALGDRRSWMHQVAVRFRRLIKRRIGVRAFHPNASQRILFTTEGVFTVLRETRDRSQRVLAVTNLLPCEQRVSFSEAELGPRSPEWRDLVSGRVLRATSDGGLALTLRPYGLVWLTPSPIRESP
jgi:sucrose phosphorylase